MTRAPGALSAGFASGYPHVIANSGRAKVGVWANRDGIDMTTNDEERRQTEPIDRRRLITSTISSLLILVLCLFLPAGTWAWFRGWLFLVVLVAASVLITRICDGSIPMSSPVGSTTSSDETLGFDLGAVLLLPTMLAILIVAAVDDGRYHWSHLPWWGFVIGYALLMTGMVGLTWAQSVNKFFEPSVRIQTDRGHKVIDTGPYAIIRHPGYALGYLLFLGIPLALGSLWALIPAILMGPLLVLRTIWEDQTLRDELPG